MQEIITPPLPARAPLPAGRAQASTARLEWLWLLPFAAALYYPWALRWAHAGFVARDGSGVAPLLSLLTAYLAPLAGFLALYALGRQAALTDRLVLARRLAHLAVAAPPAYTLLGVLLYLMKINGHDIAVWTGLWIALAALSAMTMRTTLPRPAVLDNPAVYSRLRVGHGIASLALLLAFLAPHLFNHMLGVLGNDVHMAVMDVLRAVYRHGAVEPVLITLFFLQILSGLVLLKPKTARRADMLDSLQTASGIYLAFFIASHINSVFVLARYFGTDTNYAWAIGEPVGLVGDAWNIRLLPHYSIAVWLLIVHLACGLRVVMRGHGASESRSAAAAWGVIGVGSLVTMVITAGMTGLRLA